MKAAVFFILGLLLVMGVLGGIENTVDIDLGLALQYLGTLIVGFSTMLIGVSYAQE
jgi:hypothetical protein